MLLVVGTNFAAYLFGSYAIYKQNLTLYSAVFMVNVSFGVTVFMAHCLGNPKVRLLSVNL